MKHNRLMASIALGLFAAAGAAQAQDGWYVAPAIGYYNSDEDRLTEEGSVFGALGIGRYFGNNAAIEFAVDRTTRSNDWPGEGNFANLGFGLTYRQFFGDGSFKPYILVGGGVNRHDREGSETGYDFMANAGAGVSYDFTQRVRGRLEAFYRYDMDDESIQDNLATENVDESAEDFGDWVIALGVQMALGQVEAPVEPEPLPEPTPPPAEPHCSELDGDGDGVNDCDDRCPNTTPGTVVGPDGCELEVAVDLRGVEFDFDKSTLRPESQQTLNEATEVLRQYPDIRVEVAGHTDSIGTDQYNQGLSERRAQAVYDYLVNNGIDASRLNSRGYGEGSPIADNATREGRQRNRRVELVVQN
jgi:OOP family OmpA-OmpF porin